MLDHDADDHRGQRESGRGRELDRRQFLGAMGATAAVASSASVSGCIRKPVEHILPYSRRPEDLIPGNAMYFATAFHIGGAVEGLLVESQDGRPMKIEGNPKHPVNLGGASAWAQAWIADLYDADRTGTVRAAQEEVEWAKAEAFLAELGARLEDGDGTALLLRSEPSPTFQRLLADLRAKAPKMAVYRHDLAGNDNARAGAKLVGAEAACRPSSRRPPG